VSVFSDYKKEIMDAANNDRIRLALSRAIVSYRNNTSEALKRFPQTIEMAKEVREIKKKSIAQMEKLKASIETQRLFEGGEYTKYLYLHGLSVETAEALAEYHHKKMREELGIAGDDSPHIRDLFHQKYRGSRYSFGYPACPNLEDQTKLFALLHPEENVGVRLTSGFLLEPEQSTSAIVAHHPSAKYFVV
jgi:hypothetical protein